MDHGLEGLVVATPGLLDQLAQLHPLRFPLPSLSGIYPYGACRRSFSSIFVQRTFRLLLASRLPSPWKGIMRAIPEVLLVWVLLYACLLAAVGFLLVLVRGFTGRPRSTVALLRTASTVAFVLALTLWLGLLILDL